MEEIFVPASGMAMEEALLAEWLKEPGDAIGPGDVVAVVETDKASVELAATTVGVLGRQRFQAGESVRAGSTIAVVLADGESEAGDPAPERRVAAGDESVASPDPTDESLPVHLSAAQPHSMSPRQRRAALLAAAGPPPPFNGFTSARSQERSTPPPVVTVPPGVAARPAAVSSGASFREAIAAQVAESWRTIPHFAVGREIDARGLMSEFSTARRYNRTVTITDFLLAAFGQTLAWQGKSTDIGLAVATEWGVLIPVVRDCAGIAFDELSDRRRAAVDRARTRRLSSDDSLTPYASLSNLGTMGIDWFTGIIPLNQSALLTVGRIVDRPVVEGRGIAVRPEFSATLVADHRVLDGADAAVLLGHFASEIESIGEENAQ